MATSRARVALKFAFIPYPYHCTSMPWGRLCGSKSLEWRLNDVGQGESMGTFLIVEQFSCYKLTNELNSAGDFDAKMHARTMRYCNCARLRVDLKHAHCARYDVQPWMSLCARTRNSGAFKTILGANHDRFAQVRCLDVESAGIDPLLVAGRCPQATGLLADAPSAEGSVERGAKRLHQPNNSRCTSTS